MYVDNDHFYPHNTRTHSSHADPLEIINLRPSDTVTTSQANLVFVGVMTAKEFLGDRAKAVYDTWGNNVPGRLAFFSSEGSVSASLPVIALKGVDDRYPPQKKSFRMLYYMYEHYIDRFEWFARADDDVYINTEKLGKFLRSIDSLKPQFIGKYTLLLMTNDGIWHARAELRGIFSCRLCARRFLCIPRISG